MLVVSYDAVSGELDLDLEDGHPPRRIAKVPRIFFKLYGEGYLGCEVAGEAIDLFFGFAEEVPVELVVEPVEPGHWRVRLIPLDNPIPLDQG